MCIAILRQIPARLVVVIKHACVSQQSRSAEVDLQKLYLRDFLAQYLFFSLSTFQFCCPLSARLHKVRSWLDLARRKYARRKLLVMTVSGTGISACSSMMMMSETAYKEMSRCRQRFLVFKLQLDRLAQLFLPLSNNALEAGWLEGRQSRHNLRGACVFRLNGSATHEFPVGQVTEPATIFFLALMFLNNYIYTE